MLATPTKFSGSVRIGVGLALLGSVIGAGYAQRSPWAILLLGTAFLVAWVASKWRAWRPLWVYRAWRPIGSALLVSGLIQLVLVGALYLMGFGLRALCTQQATATGFDTADLLWALGTATLGVSAAVLLSYLERPRPTPSTTGSGESQDNAATHDSRVDLRVLPAPLTPSTLFTGIHFSHRGRGDDDDTNGRPNQQSCGGDDKITAAEARLGVRFPEGLRAVYRAQNGGSVRNVCVPKPGRADPTRFADIDSPFGGYEDLYPTEMVCTVFDSTCAVADPNSESDAHMFPEGCKQLVILAQWYQQTLFLDYTQPGEPGVGFTDFDHPDWRARALRWPDFATFFASLRRFETVD